MKRNTCKKAALFAAVVAAVLAAGVMFAACGKEKSNPAEFVGVYKFEYEIQERLSESGQVLEHWEYHLGDPYPDSEPQKITEDYYVLTLNADGSCQVQQPYGISYSDLTWDAEGNTISIHISGQTSCFIYNDGYLTLTQSVKVPWGYDTMEITTMNITMQLKKQIT